MSLVVVQNRRSKDKRHLKKRDDIIIGLSAGLSAIIGIIGVYLYRRGLCETQSQRLRRIKAQSQILRQLYMIPSEQRLRNLNMIISSDEPELKDEPSILGPPSDLGAPIICKTTKSFRPGKAGADLAKGVKTEDEVENLNNLLYGGGTAKPFRLGKAGADLAEDEIEDLDDFLYGGGDTAKPIRLGKAGADLAKDEIEDLDDLLYGGKTSTSFRVKKDSADLAKDENEDLNDLLYGGGS